MTKKQFIRLHQLENSLARLGFTAEEITQLRRISNTLHRWHEMECGDANGYAIERENENGSGRPFLTWSGESYTGKRSRVLIADREAGALRRLAAIMERHPEAVSYVQGDPRGCALWIVPKAQLNDGAALDSVYARGVAVCID